MSTRDYVQPEADQAERRAMLRQDQAARCYFEIAQGGDPDAASPSTVVGTSAKPYGHDLPGPQWAKDLGALAPERPLGIDINAVNDTEAVWFDPDYIAPEEAPNAEA